MAEPRFAVKRKPRARSTQSGQVLALIAIVLSIVLLPIAGYAVDASIVASRTARLQAATAEAAETAAQQLDVGVIRVSDGLALDAGAAIRKAARIMTEEEPSASTNSVTVDGASVTIATSEAVTLPFSLFTPTVSVHAKATARLVAGYDSPSSR